jgi:hypothetical protein
MRAQRVRNPFRNTDQIGEAQPDLVARLAGETGDFLSVLFLVRKLISKVGGPTSTTRRSQA